VSFAAITLCVASQRVFIVAVVYFVIDSVRKLLDTRMHACQPTPYQIGTEGPFLGVKRPGRESDHSPPSSTEVKNTWKYTSTPP
jgi:hypothetical protein